MNAKEYGHIIHPLQDADAKTRELRAEMAAIIKHTGCEEGHAYADAGAVAKSLDEIQKQIAKGLAAAHRAGHDKVVRTCGDLKTE